MSTAKIAKLEAVVQALEERAVQEHQKRRKAQKRAERLALLVLDLDAQLRDARAELEVRA